MTTYTTANKIETMTTELLENESFFEEVLNTAEEMVGLICSDMRHYDAIKTKPADYELVALQGWLMIESMFNQTLKHTASNCKALAEVYIGHKLNY